MQLLYAILDSVNKASAWLCDLVLGPAHRIGPWTAMLLISLLAGVGALWVIKRVSNQAAVQRSKDVHDVIGMDMCSFITLIDEQTANWQRDEAQDPPQRVHPLGIGEAELAHGSLRSSVPDSRAEAATSPSAEPTKAL